MTKLDFHTADNAPIPRVMVYTLDDDGEQDEVVAEFPITLAQSVGEAESAALAYITEHEEPRNSKYMPWDEEPRDCLSLATRGRTRNNEP